MLLEQQAAIFQKEVNLELLQKIPVDAKRIVEMGNMQDNLAQPYQQRMPNAEYIVAQSMESSREIIQGLLTQGKKIDCLIDRQFLEQTSQPIGLLQEYLDWLSDEGQLLICIPNSQYWSKIAQLLQGNAVVPKEQLIYGRSYTVEEIKNIFQRAGLYIDSIWPVIPMNEEGQQTAKLIVQQAVQAIGNQAEYMSTLLATSYYIVRAVKKKPASSWLLQSLLGEPKACARVRIYEPHSFCTTTPGIRAVQGINGVNLGIELPGEQKVFIWQRMELSDFSKQEELLRRGYLTIYEMDDHPMKWPQLYQNTDFMPFRACHAVQVSTAPLAEYLRHFNPNIAVFPNQVAEIPPPKEYSNQEKIKLFFGALNREEDYQDILPVLNQILQQYVGQVEVAVVHDKKFFSALKTPHKEFFPFLPYNHYQEILRQSDIALLPLQQNNFNEMKSDLKYIECAAQGVVVIASPTVYQESIRDGQTGVLYHTPQEFGNKLVDLLQDADLRVRIAKQAYTWVKEHRLLCYHYKQRMEWYESLYSQYDRLTGEIYQRVKRS